MISVSSKTNGFTLVELLVVISIIGILSSFAIVSLNSARIKARDALRKGDMAQLRTALNLYYDDYYHYPICDESDWNDTQPDMGSTPQNGSDCYNGNNPQELTFELTSGSRPYMDKTPKDPKNLTNSPAISTTYLYRYISKNNGEQCAVIYYLEENPTTPKVMRGY